MRFLKGISCLSSALFVAITLSGCQPLASQLIPSSRTSYNDVLLRSDEEQLLLNIVRMRYGERPYFLNIDNITASNSVSLSGPGSYNDSRVYQNTFPTSITKNWSLSPTASYSDSPTVFYSPIQGEKFTRQMLSPISMQNIYLLLQSGWSIARVFRVIVQRAGTLENAISASRPNTKHVPDFEEFIFFAHHLRDLERDRKIALGSGAVGDDPTLDIVPLPQYKNDPDIIKLYRLFKISTKYDRIRFIIAQDRNQHDNIISIQPRSVLSILYYLSKSVEVPQADIKKGFVVQPAYPNGKPFDWRVVTDGMMTIKSSYLSPKDASVAIKFDSRWFYISRSDPDSKETLAMVEQLYNLQAGDVDTKAPLVTLSI